MAKIHAVIEHLPQVYKSEIGPRILIFDEATSNLGPATAEHFAKTVNGLSGKVTMLFITHALPNGLRIRPNSR